MFRQDWIQRVALAIIGCLSAVVAVQGADVVITPTEFHLDYFGILNLVYSSDSLSRGDIEIKEVVGLGNALGLKSGDVVESINGLKWHNLAQAQAVLKQADVQGRIKLGLRERSPITLVMEHEQKRVLKLLGLDLMQGMTDIEVKLSSGAGLKAGLRVGDKLLLLDGEPYRTEPVFRHTLAAHFLEQTEVTLLVESRDGERLKVTLPPLTDAGRGDAPLLTRGVSSLNTGRHVEFPPHLGPTGEVLAGTNHDRRKSLANEIVSARVELYYFRDAHRVAQILNRHVKSYNGAAVTQHERAAETAREQFEEKRLDRRRLESESLQAAKELQDLECELVRHVGALRAELERQQNSANAQAASAAPAPAPAAPASTTSAVDVAELRKNIETALKNVQTKRIETLKKQAATDRANDMEQNAAKEQFRREVSAAKIDPDTYVPGDIASIDPVTQVSISVIGEGVLHLRGPRLGVNKVRYMIDEIDHPVGQVKIGVMTLQVNGENGHRMENTMRRLEGQVSLARHMATLSNQYFQRALVETANTVAVTSMGLELPKRRIPNMPCPPEFFQDQRWQKYLEAFFGDDFMAELAELDPRSSVLDPLHKLLSMNSMDTITLGEALFMTGLAKASVRAQILQRFQMYLECELPEKEAQWIITNRMYHCLDSRWWGDAETGREKTYKNAGRRYKFDSILAFFLRQYDCGELSSDVLNPLQRQVTKLVQGISLEHALKKQRDSLQLKRSLIEKMDEKESAQATRLNPFEKYFLDQQIDELEERHLKATESLRGQKAAIDKLIKSVVIAIEDDVYAQFYNPALEKIRTAAREWDVELSAIERTTILTNNRAFGKVSPQATFEFDLPRRDIVVVEALKAAYALHQDLGPLLSDPNFTTLTKMMSNGPLNGDSAASVKNALPGLPSDTDQKDLLFGDSTAKKHFGTELEKLVPDPAIYKFETGTGFEIRPVVQPDGQSVAFDFNYMYTTDLLEPVRANEKHLGRVKRHFINTEVQLGNLEWREISRYEVALKATRNARGVPLLEDIPVAGVMFRPLPQAQKSIQKNVIVGQAAIYPTIQDLLGLKAIDLCHENINEILETANVEVLKNRLRFQNTNQRMDQDIDALLNLRYSDAKASPYAPKAVPGKHAESEAPNAPVVVPPAPTGASSRTLPPSAVRGASARSPVVAPPMQQSFGPQAPSPAQLLRPADADALPLIAPPASQRPAGQSKLPIIKPAGFEQQVAPPLMPPKRTDANEIKRTSYGNSAGKAMRTAPEAAPPRRLKPASDDA